jgi:hypothetical protein
LLAVQLYRTRGVMARPVSRRPPLARGRIQPARPRSAVGTAARAAIPARQPLAIEAELLLPADRQQALAASAGDVVTTR